MMKKLIALYIAAVFVYGCKPKSQSEDHSSYQNFKHAEMSAAKISPQPCNCLPAAQANNCLNNTPNTVIKAYMGTQTSKTVTITWNNCITTPYQPGPQPGCDQPLSNYTTTLVMCYSQNSGSPCNTVNARFIGKPECLPCMPSEFCIDLSASQSGNYGFLTGTYNNETLNNVTIQVIISADPDITIKCSSDIGGTNQVNYTCFGNW